MRVLAAIRDTLLPTFAFTNPRQFQEQLPGEEDGSTFTQAFFEVTVNRVAYQQTLRFDPQIWRYRTSQDIDEGVHIGPWDFKIVNDYLADQNSPLRLFVVDDKDRRQQETGSNVGFILLDSTQAKAFRPAIDASRDFAVSGYNGRVFDNSFNRGNLTNLIRSYKKLGLLTPLDDQTLNASLTRMIRDGVSDNFGVLRYLPNVVASVSTSEFTLEGVEEIPKDVFRTLISRLIKTSGDEFAPVNVVEKAIKKGKVTSYKFEFTFKGKSYRKIVKDHYDFFSEGGLMDMVSTALKDAKAPGKFYPVGYGSEDSFIFLTPAQYEALKANQPSIFPTER